eukprot:TRINITY_DN9287_c0_g1_i1.p2 TRINITY_DN9287_c0_g1~~TRINITY_DN9287_c0_g1_i1.p2  ORF type:complete len:126 (+),score=53.64 TRINITY_DN9287_c0_g1_i1:61-438(+)
MCIRDSRIMARNKRSKSTLIGGASNAVSSKTIKKAAPTEEAKHLDIHINNNFNAYSININIGEGMLQKIKQIQKIPVQRQTPKLDPIAQPRSQTREKKKPENEDCLLYTSPSPRDQRGSRMPSSA